MRDEQLTIEPTPSPEEGAAIAAAIAAHQRANNVTDDGTAPDTWEGKQWQYAGRIEQVTGRCVTPPRELPANPWSMMGRLVR